MRLASFWARRPVQRRCSLPSYFSTLTTISFESTIRSAPAATGIVPEPRAVATRIKGALSNYRSNLIRSLPAAVLTLSYDSRHCSCPRCGRFFEVREKLLLPLVGQRMLEQLLE